MTITEDILLKCNNFYRGKDIFFIDVEYKFTMEKFYDKDFCLYLTLFWYEGNGYTTKFLINTFECNTILRRLKIERMLKTNPIKNILNI